jgi:hypothetical protein
MHQILNLKYQMMLRKTIICISYFIAVSFMIACAKTELVSELDFQKNLLSGTGAYQNTKKIWKIDSATENGKIVIRNGVSVLTPTSKKITTISFGRDGSYYESDGNSGSWTLPSIKELRVNVVDGINGNKRAFKYEVVDLNAARLHLKYDSGIYKQDLYYNIFN